MDINGVINQLTHYKMNRSEAKELLPIIQAFAEGKTIQIRKHGEESYYDSTNNKLNFDLGYYSYRVKPEPKYRPFKDADECWQEMLKHEPFGWLREKKRNVRTQIGFMHTEGIQGTSGGSSNYKAFFDCFSFADGAPFGVKEEVWEN